jgi:hypothetical protein
VVGLDFERHQRVLSRDASDARPFERQLKIGRETLRCGKERRPNTEVARQLRNANDPPIEGRRSFLRTTESLGRRAGAWLRGESKDGRHTSFMHFWVSHDETYGIGWCKAQIVLGRRVGRRTQDQNRRYISNDFVREWTHNRFGPDSFNDLDSVRVSN